GYYRGGKKGKEIDIVVDYPRIKNILIEVKYREAVSISEEDAIVEMSGEASAAIVVTKNTGDFGIYKSKSGKDIIRIPAFAFLYLLGHAEKNGYKGID
ncbi:MAG TPA: AAA family ATPase, partial [Thermoclostridium caenicola]|nr:AAA family ATPase [Thermoclostridium caenicola]